jgi:hypothetical protein
LRENGWIIQETDPQLKKQAYWLATERDNWTRKEYGDDWVESLAEARHYLPQEAA